MKIFACDIEATTFKKGDPFAKCNQFVLGAIGDCDRYHTFVGDARCIQSTFDDAQMVVFFNAKFDLHWLRRLGLRFSVRLPIWDCQLAEFILSNQRWKYPSLDGACAKRNLPRKLDVVKTEYWDKGIDTTAVPFDILNEYLQGDIVSTYSLYLDQVERFKQPEHAMKYRLFRLQCYDLMTLEEMEWNGFKFAEEEARAESRRLEGEITALDNRILGEFPDIPINLGSPNHISVMLYGGTITGTTKVPVGVFKTGVRQGQVKYQNVEQVYELPRLIEPLKGSELAKEGYYSTNEDVLRSLKANAKGKKIIDALLERRGLEKLRGTYYDGIPNLIAEHDWQDSIVHGAFNQCVTITGRLSGTKPNQQNLPGDCKRYCVSRYE